MVICTSQKTVIPLLQEGAKKGVGGAVVFASGYGEVGTAEGKQNEAELIAAAKELDIAVMGPNCAGIRIYLRKKRQKRKRWCRVPEWSALSFHDG